MASVFLSYDRDDAASARSLARALEQSGHSVWWDRHIKGGAQYSDEIEEALQRADAVVVLWSPASIKSAWVRDEAAAGRDSGRLVPVLVKKTDPPMGFRQYQTIDLTKWKGKIDTPSFGELLAALGTVDGPEGGPNARSIDQVHRSRGDSRQGRLLLLVAFVLCAVAIGVWQYWRSKDSVPTVAVTAANSSPLSQGLARDLFVKLGMLPDQGELRMRLVEAPDAAGVNVDFIFEMGTSTTKASDANLVMLAGDERALLWSKDFKLPPGREADLKEQAAYNAAHVLRCALGIKAAGISVTDQLTRRYLEGCSVLAEFSGVFVRPALPAFEEVVRKRPDFEEGWSNLLIAQTQVATGATGGSEENADYHVVRRLIRDVRKRFPDNAAAFYAEIEMLPIASTKDRLALSERAVRAHPQNPFLLQQRAFHLFRVGRVREAIEHAGEAARSDFLSARTRADYIAVLAYSGSLDRAYEELAEGERLWPGSFAMLDASSRVHQRLGDPKKALSIARSGIFGDNPAMEAFLVARIDPSPSNIENALSETRSMFGRDPRALGFLMQALGAFGREDELYDFFARWEEVFPAGSNETGTAGVLFRQPLHKFRQDPRFMSVAARFGLVSYWQETGKWPDFCAERDLPYDCKTEAAKVKA